MFSNKLFFSGVSCPYQDECRAIHCVFSHDIKEQARSSQRPDEVENKNRHESNTIVEPQRKRRKVEQSTVQSLTPNENVAPPLFSLQHEQDGAEQYKAKKRRFGDNEGIEIDATSASKLESLQRKITPPPTRRERIKPQSPGGKTPIGNKTPNRQSRPSALKKESLNPRMLKAAPAPHEVRFKLLRALHDQYVRLNKEASTAVVEPGESIVLSEQVLITMALDFEEQAAVNKPLVYSNTVKNNILKYKKMSIGTWIEERQKELVALKSPSPETPMTVPKAPAEPVSLESGLSAEDELKLLPQLYTPVENLPDASFVLRKPNAEEIKQARDGLQAAQGFEVCERCKTRFQVFPGRRNEDGVLCSGGTCTYHWGKAYYSGGKTTDRQRKYICCGENVGDSAGCARLDSHVFKVSDPKRLATILNFEHTPENTKITTIRPVCIDGEMGFTVNGLELIRLTATEWPSGEEIFDVLVRPFGEVLDLVTRFSGVTPQQMASAQPWTKDADTGSGQNLRIVNSPAAARDLLFSHISPATPLIGHALENDLNAIRTIHPTIIDTALLFPHKQGLPYRNALRILVRNYLGREIQVVDPGEPTGHDSKEDANAAGDLVRYALKEKWASMKRQGWNLVNGEFKPHLNSANSQRECPSSATDARETPTKSVL